MHCFSFHFAHIVMLCWIVRSFRAQQMSNQRAQNSNGQRSYLFYQQHEYPRDCEEARYQCSSESPNGVYLIKPDGYPERFEIYCDNDNVETWSVLLRRNDRGLSFNRSWDEYKDGFGFLSQEFWIGSEKLSYLTNQMNYELRINIIFANGSSCYVNYDTFRTTDEFDNYKISELEQYSGNAGDYIPLCPINTKPGNCSCQKTCADPSGCVDTCNVDDICVCSDSFYLKGDHCVSLAECARCQMDGINIPEGGFYINRDCTFRADCSNGQLIWDNTYMCGANEACEERDNKRQCYTDDVDCLDVYNDGFTSNGLYTIKPTNWPGSSFQVYCNMTDGGVSKAVDGAVDFYRNWTSYQEGFGSLDHEHWLGNDKLYYLTNQKRYILGIDFVNLDNSAYYAKFDHFRVNDETDNYRLSQLGSYSGTADDRGSSHSDAGHALFYHLNHQFSTHDRGGCAVNRHGAWWYRGCYWSNLNGRYDTSTCTYVELYWYSLPGSRCNKYVEMKLRPF